MIYLAKPKFDPDSAFKKIVSKNQESDTKEEAKTLNHLKRKSYRRDKNKCHIT